LPKWENGKCKKGDWDLSNGTQKNFEFHLKWIKACRRVLKPQGTIWISGTYHSIYQCGFALELAGFHSLNLGKTKTLPLTRINYSFRNSYQSKQVLDHDKP